MRVYCFSESAINAAPRHNLQTSLPFCARFVVYFTLFLLFFCVGGISAQNLYKITGKVIDKDKNAVEFASVVLSDNATKKLTGTATDINGVFALNAKAGLYTLEVSLIGYEKYTLNITVDKDINLNELILKEDVSTLKEIKVTANRVDYNMSGYEYKIGNIAELKNKDLTDVLMTAPGIMVARNVTLYGSRISNIYVDRRRVKLDDESLLTYLNSFKGENIEKIEVISDPDISERYGGTAIKITTKKQAGGFMSASVRASGNENKFVVNPDFNLNYRRGKLSFYTSGSYSNMYQDKNETLKYDWKDLDKQVNDITTEKFKLPYSAMGTLGVGYDISKNDYLSAEVSYREMNRDQKRKTVTETTGADSEVSSDGSFRDYNSVVKTPTVSLMYTHSFKDASELTVTGDYLGSYIKDEIVTGSFVVDNGIKKEDKIANTENNTSSFIGYANYSKRFNKKHNLNTGLQYSYINNEAINNELSFTYNESVLRPFASYSVNFKRFGIRTGVQAQWANIDNNDYFDVIPNASVNYYLNERKGHVLSASYAMRVVRPTISQLNPDAVLSQHDIFVSVGNPNLESYYSNSYGLKLTLFNSYKLSVDYNRADDAITSYLYSDDKGTIYQSYTNNGSNRGVFASFHASKYLFNKLNIDFDIAYSFTESKVGDNRHTYNSLSYTLFAVLRLPKSYSLRAIVFGTTRKAVSHNAYRKDPTNIDLELTKRLKRWNIGFSVSDIFDSHKKGGNVTIDMGDYTQTVSNNVSYRSYQLKLSYNFNWGKAGRVRRAETQKSDMSGRIGRN